MIIFVFGRAGVGKNYVSQIIQNRFGYHHVDADIWLPATMVACLHNKEQFTLAMVDEFTAIIAEKTRDLAAHHQKLVVSQALYRQSNRMFLADTLAPHPVRFLHIEAPRTIINQRLRARNDWVDLDYAEDMDPYFEPMPTANLIDNTLEGQAHLSHQLAAILR